jgi:LacI family transcriptional regulator
MRKRPLHIGVLIETSRAYGRGIATGIIQFAREHDWILFPQESGLFHELPPWILREKLDGAIANVYSSRIARQIARLMIPVVDTYCQGHLPGAPMIETDPDVAGRLAGTFFIQAGYTRFAYCGFPGIYFSDRREKAFVDLLQSRGLSCDCYVPPPNVRRCLDLFQRERGGMEYEKDLARWIRKIPKPVAIFTCNDIRGQQLLNACRDYDIRAPGEVAVLGLDNDHLICEMSHPTLSSIVPDTEGIGRLAAETLDQLMSAPPSKAVSHGWRKSIPPLRIVERQSTDIIPDAHPVIAHATRIIRDEACNSLTVDMLCDKLHLGRTHLDLIFRNRLGRTTSREISRIRIARARSLLQDTDLPLAEIARQSGFLTLPHFCRVIKRETGHSAGQLRQTAS